MVQFNKDQQNERKRGGRREYLDGIGKPSLEEGVDVGKPRVEGDEGGRCSEVFDDTRVGQGDICVFVNVYLDILG